MKFFHIFLLCFGICACLEPFIVDLRSTADLSVRIAVQICSGFLNRNNSNFVYTLMNDPYDVDWLDDLYHITDPTPTPIDSLMAQCLSAYPRYIAFNASFQMAITPNLITLSSVLDAVLLEADSGWISEHGPERVFDAVTVFGNASALTVSEWMFDHHVDSTSTLSFMNPHPLNPGLVDYIARERVFTFYLDNACIRGTAEYRFTLKMVTPSNNPWSDPVEVMGYNDAWPVAGDLFEAETDCNVLHNMGQIASSGFNNLAALSSAPSITEPLHQTPSPSLSYNASKTYLAFTIGDGDNLSFIKGSRRQWMKDRVARCAAANGSYAGCFSLQWTMSPHLVHLAPSMLRWYYNQSYLTQNDYFVLPPSGHLYAYPSEMDADGAQKHFVAATNADCRLLGCNSTVAWEFVFTWNRAIAQYFPKYGKGTQCHARCLCGHLLFCGFFGLNILQNLPCSLVLWLQIR